MATSSPTAIKPIQHAKETLIGMTITLEQRFGCQPRNDLKTTLNSKLNVFPDRAPLNERLVKYFRWGVGGRVNDTDNLTSAQFVKGTNMDLYKGRPFRAVTLENDLSAEERAKYALREVRLIGGVPYCLYHLKKIDFSQSKVQYIKTDPVSGAVIDYALDYGNLNPTPPAADSNGVITDISDSVSVVLPGTVTITGQEVLESMSVIDGGDPRYGIPSEIGFVSASTESVTAVDFSGKPFSYDEAMCAQMVDQYDWVGTPLMSTADSFSRNLRFSMKNLIIQS